MGEYQVAFQAHPFGDVDESGVARSAAEPCWTSGLIHPSCGQWQAVAGCLAGYRSGMRCASLQQAGLAKIHPGRSTEPCMPGLNLSLAERLLTIVSFIHSAAANMACQHQYIAPKCQTDI